MSDDDDSGIVDVLVGAGSLFLLGGGVYLALKAISLFVNVDNPMVHSFLRGIGISRGDSQNTSYRKIS